MNPMKRVVVVLCELWMLKLTAASKMKYQHDSSEVIPVAHLPTQGSPVPDDGARTLSSDPLDLQGLEKVSDFHPCYRKGHFMPTDDDVCGRPSKKPTSVRMIKTTPAKIPEKELKECPPTAAVLLTGLMRDWEPHIDSLEKSTLEPCNTDVFIATDVLPAPLKKRLGTRLKSFKEAPCSPDAFHEVWRTKDGPFTPPWCQWLHLQLLLQLLLVVLEIQQQRFRNKQKRCEDSLNIHPTVFN